MNVSGLDYELWFYRMTKLFWINKYTSYLVVSTIDGSTITPFVGFTDLLTSRIRRDAV